MPSLMDFFDRESIAIYSSADDWSQAIDLSMKNILERKYITPDYIQAIKDTTREIGPYYLLAPGIAMPHARPECGALHTALSFTLLRQGVSFDAESPPVRLLIGLAAKDSDSHIEAIQALSEILCEDEVIDELLNSKNTEELINIIQRY
ncbi:PTS mannitol transporter subunit IIA [Rahnella ecdela]|uniref:PTS mannitol transporter subunit IIA n=1 Tax=Rahnella ecdela TaxID=2816250 RepID=A0ABS6LIQ0_9GAMM|nr:PTS mannitol transporter subunit IIA [Rahnella ecdela]MBU9846409.1 PTS mannitol transporter subunit IIA [Rahnella ecdela]